MANRKGVVANTAEDTVDRRPLVPGIYRRVLPVVCLREISRSPRFAFHGLLDLHDPQAAAEEAEMAALAEQLVAERLAAGEPIEARSYDLRELPGKLPPPLDKLGFDPAPRQMIVTPDDRVDATAHFHGLRRLYERARYSRNCDHGFFQAAFALEGEWGV
ncbi:hypothetical protein [Mycobacterium sp.]|uniref:hypothetical protein n=1 Tax=Mycobacterium sp. TaxID=1785 RepID=UPI003F965566